MYLDTPKIVIDIETVGSSAAEKLLDPVRAPKTYKDPAKIDAYCKEEFEKRVASAALEADLCEVVAVGWHAKDGLSVVTTGKVMSEAEMVASLWDAIADSCIIGFNSLSFDLPVLIRRSQVLGLKYPKLNLDRYRSPHTDLLEELSFKGKLPYRSLAFYGRLFKLPATLDPHRGSDIGALVAKGDWAAVAHHCRCDVDLTAALARKLGYLPLRQEAEVF